MHIVYLLRSKKKPNHVYVGLCGNMKRRLAEHNAGECKTTADNRPWDVDIAVYFRDEKKAHAFERYLKTRLGSSILETASLADFAYTEPTTRPVLLSHHLADLSKVITNRMIEVTTSGRLISGRRIR